MDDGAVMVPLGISSEFVGVGVAEPVEEDEEEVLLGTPTTTVAVRDGKPRSYFVTDWSQQYVWPQQYLSPSQRQTTSPSVGLAIALRQL